MISYANLIVNGLVQGMVIGLAALALTLVFAVARFPNAATGDLMTVGAYGGIAVQSLGSRNIFLQGFAAVALCTVVSVACYWFAMRYLRGRGMLAALLASMGIALFIRGTLSFFVGQEQYVFQIPIVRPYVFHGVIVQTADLWLALVALAIMTATFAVLFLTPIGRRMRAVADNVDLALASRNSRRECNGAAMGTSRHRLRRGRPHPRRQDRCYAGNRLVRAATSFCRDLDLGGAGSPIGAIVAGVLLGVIQEVSTPFVGFTYKIALSFIVLTGILIVRPRGLFGSLEVVR